MKPRKCAPRTFACQEIYTRAWSRPSCWSWHLLRQSWRAGELFIENATTDFERRRKRVPPPDLMRWHRPIYNLQLLPQLTCDADYKNARNNIIDPNWRV